MDIMDRIFQVLMDVVVGIALYFGLTAFVPSMGTNVTVVITLAVTAVYAEFVENRLKRINGKHKENK